MKEWARDISFFLMFPFPNTTISILSFQKSFFKSTITSPFLCNYILLYVFSSFLQVFHHTHEFVVVFFLDCFGSWVFVQESNLVHCNVAINCCLMRWLQALQLKHWWCARNIVNLPDLITSNTLTTVMEKAFQWRKALELLTEVGFLKGKPTWKNAIFLKRQIFCQAKKSSKKQHQWFFIPAPSNGWCLNPNGLLNSHPNSHPFGTTAAGSRYIRSLFWNQSEMRSSMHKSCA